MTVRPNIITAFLPVLFLSSLTHAADIKMDVSANRDNIYIGEPIVLTVSVSGLDSLDFSPDLSAITNCSCKALGSQSKSYFSFTQVNGKVTKSGFSGRVFTYELAPQSTGVFQAGPVKLTADGRTISIQGPNVKVTGIEKQDWVGINIKASREAVLADEPFEITLSMRLKRLAGQYADIEPVDPGDPPTLTIPFLEGNPFPGLETPNIEKILNEHLVNRSDAPGFAINNYSLNNNPMNSIFDLGGFRRTRARFTFDKKVIDQNGNSYFEYTLKMGYTPKEEGSHTFGPVLFKGPAITGVTPEGSGIKTGIFAVGPAVTVRIVPPPEENRPASFIGAIGSNITAEAFIDAQTCKVGDPIKLTLAISGNTNINNINPPPLSLQDNLGRNFKIYEETVQVSTKEGKKTFTYTIRPTTAGTLEFPPIEVSYFDALSRSYKTVKTAPIPVRANESQEIGAANIIGAVTNQANEARKNAEQDSLVIAPIDMSQAGAMPDSPELKPWQMSVIVGSPLLYILFAGAGLVRRRLASSEDARKRRQAVNEAIAMLRNCIETSRNSPRDARTNLCTAIRKYLANRFEAAEAGLTPSDARNLLNRDGIDQAAGKSLCDILERTFNSAYSSSEMPDASNITEDCRQADGLIRKIEENLKTQSTPKKEIQLLCYLSVLAGAIITAGNCCAASSVTAPDSAPSIAWNPVEFQFIWNEANSRMSSASSPEAFQEAAATYSRLVDAGVRNGHIFYNMGTALLKAEKYDSAIRTFLRAERYSGGNEDIRHNMLIATIRKEKNANASLPWYRVPMFWHYDISLSSRIGITVCAFAGIWLALIMRSLGSRQIYKPLLYISIIIAAILGTSAATSIQQEESDSRSYREIIQDPKRSQGSGTSTTVLPSGEGRKS